MDLDALMALRLPAIDHQYTEKDTILYALGIGYGDRPSDPHQLQFLLEDRLAAVPSICNVLAHPGFWVSRPELNIAWTNILHGEQTFIIHRPVPAKGRVRGEYNVVAIDDKGAAKGAVLHVAKQLFDVASGDRLATVTSTYMLRGDGGQGGFGEPPPASLPLPDGQPDIVVNIPTLPQAALIYRLSGDHNPIHSDPAAAAAAGFPHPILHGLCAMGLATRAVLESITENDPLRLASMGVRFTQLVYPGETIRIEIFVTDDGCRFRATSKERDLVVLDRGVATLKTQRATNCGFQEGMA